MDLIGSSRPIGFWGSFLLSLFFSPLIGAIFVATSKPKDDSPEPFRTNSKTTDSEELQRWHDLFQKGVITYEEFQKKRDAIMGRQAPEVLLHDSTTSDEEVVNQDTSNGFQLIKGLDNKWLWIGLASVFFVSLGVKIYSDYRAEETQKIPRNLIVKNQIRDACKKLSIQNGHLKFIDVVQTSDNTYVVKLQVDNTFKLSKGNLPEEQSQAKWQSITDIAEAGIIARYDKIVISINQLDGDGNVHAIATVKP